MYTMNRILLLMIAVLLATGCKESAQDSALSRDQVYKNTFKNVRLADGVPLGIELSVRWNIDNASRFLSQFSDTKTYCEQVLLPREQEILNRVANKFSSVDSVFMDERDEFIAAIKKALRNSLGEEGVEIKEVILSDLIFPVSFTKSMEKVSLKERELDAIRLQTLSNIEQAKSEEETAKADGKVKLEEARVEGELARMQAKIEQQKRLAKIAEAETGIEVAAKKAKGEAGRLNILADAELIRKKKWHVFNFDRDTSLAKIYSQHPTYANYLINKELAAKVKIAIIPPHTNANNILNINDEKKKTDDDEFEEEF